MVKEAKLRILIVGCGSIGTRHLKAFMKIKGVEVILCDPRKEALKKIAENYSLAEVYEDIKEINLERIDAMVVCVPPNTHIPLALEGARANCHLLIEKPLSNNLDEIEELIQLTKRKKLVLGVAYCLRYHPNLIRIKKMLEEKAIGTVLVGKVHAGQYFPDYRPDYRQIYFAKRKMGGGVLSDFATHSLDYIQWLMGEVGEVFCFCDKLSDLEIETEDTAEIFLRFENKSIAEVHSNCFQRDYSSRLELIGSSGTIVWDYVKNEVRLFQAGKKEWETFTDKCERDHLFNFQAINFVEAIKSKNTLPVSGESGMRTLKVVLAAYESAKEKKMVRLS